MLIWNVLDLLSNQGSAIIDVVLLILTFFIRSDR